MEILKNFFSVLIGFIFFLLCASFQYSFIVFLKKKEMIDSSKWYLILYLIMVVPEITFTLTSIWKSSCIAKDRYKHWPEIKFLMTGIIITLMESIAASYLVTELLPSVPTYVIPAVFLSISFPNALKHLSSVEGLGDATLDPPWPKQMTFSVPCMHVLDKRSSSMGNVRRSIITTIGAVFVCGNIFYGVFLGLTNAQPILQSILFVLFILVIAFSHYKPIVMQFIKSNSIGAQNAKIAYSLIRMISISLTFYFTASDGKADVQNLDAENVKSAITFIHEGDVMYLFIVTIVTGIFMQIYRFVSIRTRRYRYVLMLPILCSSIAVITADILICEYSIKDLSFLTIENCKDNLQISWEYIVLYVTSGFFLLGFLLFILFGNTPAMHTDIERYFPSYNSLFVACDVLSDQLNISENKVEEKQGERKTRIFVCTTMYQEAKHEMSRLLQSIYLLSESEEFSKRDVYLESHIFLDNGASGKEMKDFGIQLLSVIEHNLQVDEQYGTMKYTPYGIQLSWEIPGKMPVFIHIKDTSKVKAKKRWSQVMYMNYILRFRSKYLERTNLVKTPLSDSLESLDVGVYVDSSPGSSEESRSNTLRIPLVRFDMGSKTSSYSSLTTFTNVEDKDQELDSTISHEKEQSNEELENVKDVKQADELYTEHFYKFDNKSMASSANQDNSIFMISGSETADLGIVQYDDYILATDADMSFDSDSVLNLLNTCQRNPDVGGVCGRTYPIGIHWHPIVWLQMFDYAKDFWMIKSAQNVIGSVMCCPGCFSLYRFNAVRDVIDTYSEPTRTMEDIFTKDNGEDRWMCTLMMLKGWSLRYNGYGRNSTYCPEETEEFMKQRRRWLLSDFANALVVTKNIGPLMKRNTCFTMLYTLYVLQLFIVMILYPGSTIMMLALGFELVTTCPLLANVGFLTAVTLIYCFVLISSWNPTKKLIVSKLIMILLGALTLYIFVATSIVIAENMQEDFSNGSLSHLQNFVLVGVAATYVYSALIHPTEIWILSTGIIYLYYLPLLNILLPLYAVCNIIDQTWGTRDEQVATVPSMLRMPKFKRKRKKKPSIKVRYGSYASLSSSALDLSDTNQSETEFWKQLVQTFVGKDSNLGISQEERNTGLRMLRNRALVGYLAINIVWLALLCGFYQFLISKFEDKTVYGIVIICLLGISPLFS